MIGFIGATMLLFGSMLLFAEVASDWSTLRRIRNYWEGRKRS